MKHKNGILCLLSLAFLFTFTTSKAQVAFEKPQLSDPKSWSLVLVPDPQTYVKFGRNQPILDLMMAWVQESKQALNTKLVLCTGDLVEQNDLVNPNGAEANQNSLQQWAAVKSSFSKLNNQLPYVLATGNHDYGRVSAEYRVTKYDRYFSPEQNSLNQQALREVGPGFEMNVASTVNAVYEFNVDSPRKLLVMVLEFAPRDTVVQWAKKVVDQPKYKDHTVVLLTHVFLSKDNKRIESQGYALKNVNYGEALFKKLIEPSKNIQLVFSGHIGVPNDFNGHIGYREDKNAAGKKVVQMTFNAQAMGGGWHGNGGDGWLRYLEFLPDNKTVKVKTFSPFFAISPATQNLAYQKGDRQEFSFTLD